MIRRSIMKSEKRELFMAMIDTNEFESRPATETIAQVIQSKRKRERTVIAADLITAENNDNRLRILYLYRLLLTQSVR